MFGNMLYSNMQFMKLLLNIIHQVVVYAHIINIGKFTREDEAFSEGIASRARARASGLAG